jgi:hypothetical protein
MPALYLPAFQDVERHFVEEPVKSPLACHFLEYLGAIVTQIHIRFEIQDVLGS